MTQYNSGACGVVSSRTGLGEPGADTASLLSKHLQGLAYATNLALTRMFTQDISYFLEQQGFAVTTEASGNEALGLLSQSPFDLVITYLKIGEADDGVQVMKTARDPHTLVLRATEKTMRRREISRLKQCIKAQQGTTQFIGAGTRKC